MSLEDIMLSEISQKQKEWILYDSMYENPRAVKFIKTDSRILVARDWSERDRELSLLGTEFQFYMTGNILEIGCKKVWMHLTLNCPLKNCSIQVSHLVSDSVTPWIAAHQASLFITNSQSLLKLMSIKSVMTSNYLICCHPLLLPSSIFPSIRVFSNESVLHIMRPEFWTFSFSISPCNEYSGLISCRVHSGLIPGWTSLQSKGL